MKFRPDIEGLRGVAVLLVVLAHAGVPGLGGGFVGVDVFFVISGYLITGLLTAEVERTGKVDYWAFYARRARRLAPALLVMLAVVAGTCLLVVPGELLQLQLASARWAVLWVSNIYFAFARFDYFGTEGQDSLFLHTWSLGVEEQFYLLWPVLVVATWRRMANRWTWLAWLVAGSLAASLLLMPVDATSAYYLMPTRLWQLGLGGLVYRFGRGGGSAWRPAHAGMLGIGGAALLLASLVLIDESVAYPGLWAVLPAMAAACLLAAGSGAPGVVAKLLASPLLRLPGRISYSWYLWHWPALMIGPLLGWWPLGAREALAAILVSFLVSWGSYEFVEAPLRRGVRGTPRAVVIVSVLASVTLAAMLHLASSVTRPSAQGPQTLEQRVRAMITVPSVYFDQRCDQWVQSAELVPCEVDAVDGSAGLMVLVGDSIGVHWLPALEHVARTRGMRLVVLTKSSCPIVDEPFVYSRIHRRFTECEQWRESAIEHVRSVRPDVVVVGSASTYGFSVEQWTQGSLRILERLGAGERQVVVLAPSPLLTFHAPDCAGTRGRDTVDGIRVDADACSAGLASVEDPVVIGALRDAADRAGAHLLYLNDLACPGGTCRAMQGGELMFRDQQHLNASAAEALGEAVEHRFPVTVSPAKGR